jgi:hypothetical protein
MKKLLKKINNINNLNKSRIILINKDNLKIYANI